MECQVVHGKPTSLVNESEQWCLWRTYAADSTRKPGLVLVAYLYCTFGKSDYHLKRSTSSEWMQPWYWQSNPKTTRPALDGKLTGPTTTHLNLVPNQVCHHQTSSTNAFLTIPLALSMAPFTN